MPKNLWRPLEDLRIQLLDLRIQLLDLGIQIIERKCCCNRGKLAR